MFGSFIELFILFLGIIDPLLSIGVFATLTAKFSEDERRKTAFLAVLVAAVPLVIFTFFGQSVLDVLRIDLKNFQVAGGILLGILGVKMARGQSIASHGEAKGGKGVRAVASLIGTPLLVGPATITTAVITSSQQGPLITLAASLSVLALSLALLLASKKIFQTLGNTALEVTSTILGLVTLAWGVQFVRIGMGL